MSKTSKNQKGKLSQKELLTDEDLMDIFGVSKTSLRRWRNRGYLQYLKFGTRYYYPSKALRKIIKESFHPHYKKKNNEATPDGENERTNGKA